MEPVLIKTTFVLRRFLQDRSPRVSSVRECEVGCLLQCSVARTTGAETLVLAGLVTRTSVLNTLLSAVNHGSVTRAADDPSVSLRFTFHYAKQALTPPMVSRGEIGMPIANAIIIRKGRL